MIERKPSRHHINDIVGAGVGIASVKDKRYLKTG